ncbi:MAG: AAA family ATPase, partial [Dehalococcoidia bacterium]|nr:AAA family ATPase [Dehalococcoidia bacterium]
MIKSLEVRNFTAFSETRLCFTEGLNVIVGENGTGKTHLLKLPYAVMAVSAEERRR